MRAAFVLVLVLAVCIGAGIALAGDEAGQKAVSARCVKVLDGDTLVLKCDHRKLTVDLEGVDAPELGQAWGREVRGFVRDMVRGKDLEVVLVSSDEAQPVARVRVGDHDLSRMLAERGLAWAVDDGGELYELSLKAKAAPCGLWLDADPEPPWEYRAS
jgi:endonuclease YncB( thermonuclease family)